MLIGTRTLTVETNEGTKSVDVRMHLPEPSGTIWLCRYDIGWPEGKVESSAAGNDALHAVLMAMQKISQDLYMSRYHHERKMSWGKGWVGYGFPMPKNGRDLLIGHDKEFYG
jgi:hypothetical protein